MTFDCMTGAARFDAIRTADKLHLEDGDGGRELYNLPSDPYQVANRAGHGDPLSVELLTSRLAELLNCAGANCREIEDLPVDAQRTAAHAESAPKASTTH